MIAPTAAVQSGVGNRIRRFVGITALLHAALHLLAPADIWGWVALDDDLAPTLSVGAGLEQALAFAWIAAAGLLAVAGAALLLRRSWWRTPAIAGVALSQVLVVIWWTAASAGTVANLIIVAGLVFDRRVGLTAPAPAAEPYGPCCEGWEEPS